MRLLILTFSLLVFGCSIQEVVDDSPKRRVTIMGQKDVDALKMILAPERHGWYADRSTDYLFSELLLNEQVSYLLIHRRAWLRSYVRGFQNSDLVCVWKNNTKVTYPYLYTGVEAANRLKPNMLARIALILHELDDENSLRKIGALLETDLGDVLNPNVVPTEIGGLGLLSSGRVEFLTVPSTRALKLNSYSLRSSGEIVVRSKTERMESNGRYELPEYGALQISHIFDFHLHAVVREYVEDTCGPSIGKDMHGRYVDDIGATMHYVKKYGQWHSFIFTTHGSRTFATHYLAGELNSRGELEILVLNLPIKKY